jgi:hypothetical protein
MFRVRPGALSAVEAAAAIGHGELPAGLARLTCMGTATVKPRKREAGHSKRALQWGQHQHLRRHGVSLSAGPALANGVELNGETVVWHRAQFGTARTQMETNSAIPTGR